jgi:hypothetical protein
MIYVPTCEKQKFFFGNILIKIKFIFSRNSHLSPIWIFLFGTDQAQVTNLFSLSPVGADYSLDTTVRAWDISFEGSPVSTTSGKFV